MKKILFAILILLTASTSFAQQDTTKKVIPLVTGTNEELIPYKPGSGETIHLPMPKEPVLTFDFDLDQDGTVTNEERAEARIIQIDNCEFIAGELKKAASANDALRIEVYTFDYKSYECETVLNCPLEEYLPK